MARLGGDEFAIVQTGIDDTDDVMMLVTPDLRGDPLALSVPRPSGDYRRQHRHRDGAAATAPILDRILKNADLAMYAAKAAGRRTYRFF